ncbi:MAG: GNAT family N-acetyltransferase [Thermoflexales bacterium]|nr:GNAT family N-acetyltransferase [Thermoflexales bacterium]
MLYGERIRLRAIEREDAPTFVRWFNDPETRSYLLVLAPMSIAQEERWIESLANKLDDYVFAIEAKPGDAWRHIGNTGLHRIDWKHRSATFGIVLGERECWGQGYGADATRTMLAFAFGTLNLHRVELEVFEYNPRAIRCYEKSGFRREGTRRQSHFHDGRYWDAHIMAALQDEFANASLRNDVPVLNGA